MDLGRADRIVYEDVEPAVGFWDCGDEGLRLFRIAYVRGMEGHARGEIVGSVPAAHANAASCFGQSHGDDAAEATRAAGHDCDASREIKAARLWQRTVSL